MQRGLQLNNATIKCATMLNSRICRLRPSRCSPNAARSKFSTALASRSALSLAPRSSLSATIAVLSS